MSMPLIDDVGSRAQNVSKTDRQVLENRRVQESKELKEKIQLEEEKAPAMTAGYVFVHRIEAVANLKSVTCALGCEVEV
jgi:hypothetical protein